MALMHWKKLGHLFAPDGSIHWMRTHAANPFGIWIGPGLLKVFFTSRDEHQRSHIASVIVNVAKDFELGKPDSEPVLAPGPPGAFDDSGCAVGCVLPVGDSVRLYYLGWNLKVTVPWLNSIGLAIQGMGGGAFERYSPAPLMDRSREDPFSISYPSVLHENGRWRMWYGSNLQWGERAEDMQHVIKYAESRDGLEWSRSGTIAVNLVHRNEFALSKPFVVRDLDRYRMWYSYRGRGDISSYRIGYAESMDGVAWTRMDANAGIDVSEHGWDSEMVCYPFVFDHAGRRYMLYNGNGYGRTGFGVAVLEESNPSMTNKVRT
ncbi:MAG: hypothetical protein WKF61_00140 [Luteimonas sp.]